MERRLVEPEHMPKRYKREAQQETHLETVSLGHAPASTTCRAVSSVCACLQTSPVVVASDCNEKETNPRVTNPICHSVQFGCH